VSFERPLGPGIEPAAMPASGGAPSGEGLPLAVQLQILTTEHYSLMSARALAWNESFSRAGMFLSTLSGSIVALALVAQASEFGNGFRIFGLVILPVVLFIGIGTVVRMGFANYHDALCVVGMNRIRAAYRELAPEVERYFVMGSTDDEQGVAVTMAAQPGTPLVVQMLASSVMLLSVLCSILLGAIAALLAMQLGVGTAAAVAVGAVMFVFGMLCFFLYAMRDIRRAIVSFVPKFPASESPPTGPA
jgi:hypothetical protein